MGVFLTGKRVFMYKYVSTSVYNMYVTTRTLCNMYVTSATSALGLFTVQSTHKKQPNCSVLKTKVFITNRARHFWEETQTFNTYYHVTAFLYFDWS